MLVLGKNIQSANDPLTKMASEQLYQLISKPGTALASQIEQLRTVLSIDPKKYAVLKRNLPYVVCGIFNPPYRRLENFASIDCFIVDIDHLAEKNIDKSSLMNRLRKDPLVELMFASPGNDGIKLLFNLAEKCFDRQKYSIFYKLFIQKFSQQYNLEQVIDKVTSDATRACFLSFDENAWFNPGALPVNMGDYIDFENYTEVKQAQILIREDLKNHPAPPPEKKELTSDVLAEIRQKLNPKIRTEKSKDFFVPEEVDLVLDQLKIKAMEYGIQMIESHPIQYGRKLKFSLQNKWAQLNIFYGKKGYKVVKTPVTNSDAELAEVVFQILCEFFYGADA